MQVFVKHVPSEKSRPLLATAVNPASGRTSIKARVRDWNKTSGLGLLGNDERKRMLEKTARSAAVSLTRTQRTTE